MLSLNRPTIAFAGLGGLLWTVKATVITLNDGSFQPLEGVFFLGGLVALLVAAALVAHALTRRLGGPVRAAATVIATIGLLAATVLLEQVGVAAVSSVASGDNVGLEEEGGILLCGIAWLALAAAATRRPVAHAVAAA